MVKPTKRTVVRPRSAVAAVRIFRSSRRRNASSRTVGTGAAGLGGLSTAALIACSMLRGDGSGLQLLGEAGRLDVETPQDAGDDAAFRFPPDERDADDDLAVDPAKRLVALRDQRERGFTAQSIRVSVGAEHEPAAARRAIDAQPL